jgi:acylphosphatase
MADIAKHIFFSGRVQGVGFRFTALNVARRYGLTGFVQNTADGKVELLVQGTEEDINDCIEDLQQTFSASNIEIQQTPLDSSYENFDITF